MKALEERLRGLMDGYPAKSALYCVDMATGRPIAAINEDTKVVSASTIKLPVLLCALQEVMEGRLTLGQFIPLDLGGYCQDTEVFVEEYRQDGCSLEEMLYWMMVQSDNTATNAIVTLLGFEKINSYCQRLGLRSSCVQRKMLDFAAVEAGRNNYTSPADQYRCYDLLLNGKILSPELRALALDFLSRCRHMDGLQRFLSDNVTVYHKPGGLDHLSHDAGVILLPGRPYFLGIFTWEGPSLDGESGQSRFIGKLSRLIYDQLKEGD